MTNKKNFFNDEVMKPSTFQAYVEYKIHLRTGNDCSVKFSMGQIC